MIRGLILTVNEVKESHSAITLLQDIFCSISISFGFKLRKDN